MPVEERQSDLTLYPAVNPVSLDTPVETEPADFAAFEWEGVRSRRHWSSSGASRRPSKAKEQGETPCRTTILPLMLARCTPEPWWPPSETQPRRR